MNMTLARAVKPKAPPIVTACREDFVNMANNGELASMKPAVAYNLIRVASSSLAAEPGEDPEVTKMLMTKAYHDALAKSPGYLDTAPKPQDDRLYRVGSRIGMTDDDVNEAIARSVEGDQSALAKMYHDYYD